MESVFKAILESINAVLCSVGLLKDESYFCFTNITKLMCCSNFFTLSVLLVSGVVIGKYLWSIFVRTSLKMNVRYVPFGSSNPFIANVNHDNYVLNLGKNS